MRRFVQMAASAALCLGFLVTSAQAATIIVNADEWATTNFGYSQAGTANVDQYAQNLVAEMGTTLHAFSTNFAYTQSNFATSLGNAGATYTVGTGITFDLPTLNTYSGIFLGGTYLNAAQQTVLSQYVAGGGNVYISAGTGIGGPAAEAAAWNTFLSPFNIQLIGNYVGPAGNIATAGDAIFNGVSQLYFNNANGMAVTGNVVCCSANNNQALFAVSRMDPSAVPLPAGGLLLLSAGALGGLTLRRKKKS